MEEKPIKLLLIEDNPGDARLMELMLRGKNRESFELEWVERFADGLQRVAKGGIDLVLLDLSLPDSHGPETFSKFHQQAPHVPIIVLSGLDDEEVAIKTVQAGGQDYTVHGAVDTH